MVGPMPYNVTMWRRHWLYVDVYQFVYTYIDCNKDGSKKCWICEKREYCNVSIHTVTSVAVYRSDHQVSLLTVRRLMSGYEFLE
jgi:hypothetical protein